MHCCSSSWPSCAASMAFFMHSPAVLHPPGTMAATPSAAARPPSGMTAGEAGAQQQAQALGQRPQPAQPEERRQQPGLVGVHQALRPGNRPPALTDSSSGTALQPGQPLPCITPSLPARQVQRCYKRTCHSKRLHWCFSVTNASCREAVRAFPNPPFCTGSTDVPAILLALSLDQPGVGAGA